jgi:lipopolysaccharide export system protein LptA
MFNPIGDSDSPLSSNPLVQKFNLPISFAQVTPMVQSTQQQGRIRFRRGIKVAAIALVALFGIPTAIPDAAAQQSQQSGQPITLLSDVQEANAITGVVTARGNVQIFYPAQNMQATSAQAQYYSREGRIVLSGDAFVLQDGNSIQV